MFPFTILLYPGLSAFHVLRFPHFLVGTDDEGLALVHSPFLITASLMIVRCWLESTCVTLPISTLFFRWDH